MKYFKKISNIRLLFDLWKFLETKRKRQLIFISILMIFSGIFEVFTLYMVLPFLMVIIDPQKLNENESTKYLLNLININTTDSILIIVTLLFVLAIATSAYVRLLNLWFNSKFIAALGSEISNKVYKILLEEEYEFHINSNTSKLISIATENITGTVTFLNSALLLGTAIFVTIGILSTIIMIDWILAFSTIGTISIAYILLAKITKKRLQANGEKIVKLNKNVIKVLQEGFGAIREVIINSNQDKYLEIHKEKVIPLRKAYAQISFLESFPRIAMEAIGIFIITFIAFVMTFSSRNTSYLLPILGTFALAAQRLLPAIQQVYVSWAVTTSYRSFLEEILVIFKSEEKNIKNKKAKKSNLAKIKIFKKKIEFKNVYFSYKNGKSIINNFNFEIKRGERIGIVGKSGSGKSTFSDLLMGLLTPQKGVFSIDEIDIHDPRNFKYLNAWRGSLANVPQNIYLTDNTISENIAFGIDKENIDYEKLKYVSEQASILGFINSTKEGFSTYVGERGVRLSGGQRQRIGIARALYKDPKTIIFDEATSSLDYETEKEIIKTIENLSRDLTIIIIAHRLSTTKNCDRIINISNGKIIY